MNRKWKALPKRILSLFLTICLLTSLFPASFAAEEVSTDEKPIEAIPTEATPTETPPSEAAPTEAPPMETTPAETSPGEGDSGGMHGYLSNVVFTVSGDPYPDFEFDSQKLDYSDFKFLFQDWYDTVTTIDLYLSNSIECSEERPIYASFFVDSMENANHLLGGSTGSSQFNASGARIQFYNQIGSNLENLDGSIEHTLFLVIGPTRFEGTDNGAISEDLDIYTFKFLIPPYMTSITFKGAETETSKAKTIYPTPKYDAKKAYLDSLKGYSYEAELHTTYRWIAQLTSNVNGTNKLYYKIGNSDWELYTKKLENIDLQSAKPEGLDYVLIQMKAESPNGLTRLYSIKIYPVVDYTPTITEHPVGFECNKGEKHELSVAATPAAGSPDADITYQWQRTYNDYSDSDSYYSSIPGADSPNYTPPTDKAGSWYYRCVVTATVNGVSYSAKSQGVKCTVRLSHVNDFQIIRPLGSVKYITFLEFGEFKTQYRIGESFDPIYIGLSEIVESGVEYKFEVFHSTTDSFNDAQILAPEIATVQYAGHSTQDGENESHYYAVRDNTQYPVGDHYIFLRVTAVDKTNPENHSNTEVSSVKLTVIEEGFQWTKGGTGKASDPYLITDYQDLEYIRKVVNEWNNRLKGVCFKFANDITLPEGWTPIGGGSTKEDWRVFSGQIDGGGHTLTVPDGGKPLLNLVSDAVIKNLNIKGTRIDGCGLIDSYFVDWGLDGNYDTGCPEAVTMENVHLLAGSSTRRSGFMEGSGSGANTITLRNCTVASGVVIGYDGDQRGIGSFVGGSFNGQMESCYSAATVKGTTEIGGLAGGKGQSMGLCSFTNCGFTGTIEATGDWVGGIIGMGYFDSTAPNTMVVSFNNCFVKADITAKNYVGGIFGGEGGVRDAWNKCILSNSTFYGTITATGSAVGGIIGYYNGVNTNQEMENNYFCETSGRTLGVIGEVGQYSINSGKAPFASQAAADEWYANTGTAIEKDSYDAADVVQKLNSGSTSLKNWVVKGGFPAHSEDPVLIRLQINGTWPDQQLGQPLNTAGITYTGIWTKGKAPEDIPAGNVTITGYDSSKHGMQTLTAVYEGVRQDFTVVVKRPDGKIMVSFAMKGDTAHGEPTSTDPNDPKGTHTLAQGGLADWITPVEVEVSSNATVLDVIKQVLEAQTGHTYVITNGDGNYISAISRDGVELTEFTNGNKSGWMYTLNEKYSDKGVSEQYLNENDRIVFYYTDDYTLEKTDTPAKPGGDNPGATVTEYGPYLTGVLSYLKSNVTSPVVSSTKGEWAVLAQARGGTLSSDAKKAYLTNLWHHGDELGGVLDKSGYKHTEYSRVILALTSIGVDASAVKYGGKTYDFVYRLLEKDCAQVMEQGNTGTAFALIALDSGSYLNDDDGKKARSTWIDKLCGCQKADGSWSIDPDDSESDIDATAMVIQALARYYSMADSEYQQIGAQTAQSVLKEKVDLALTYLKGQQSSTDGGFGSPEADAQVIVALSALKQNAGEYKKGESRSVLSDLLSYAVGKPGVDASISFSKTRNGQTNQMSTEQAAYALAAYDRFMNNKNGLYDMTTDVTLSRENLELGVIKHTITANAGTGGSISPGTATAETGGSQTFTITPDTGYEIKDVKVDGVSVGAKSSYTLTVTKCHIVSAEFENIAGYHTITVTSGAGGTISPTTVTVEKGANQTFTITPFTGYRIVDVTIDGYSYGAKTSHTFENIESNHIISAVFASANDITVYFTLKGDFVHSSSSATHTLSKGGLQTWIPRQTVTVTKGATVYDVFTKVLNQYSYTYIGAESNYVETIITPSGTRLSEFTNGRNSGWMYTVNGIHPELGLQERTVYNGDEIIWHYTDDYTQERGGTGNSSTNTSNAAQLSPMVSGTNAVVSSSDFSNAVTAALNANSGTILVSPLGSAGASTLTVDLPTSALYTAANNGIGVTVQSSAGTVIIPSSTLTSLANTANGSQLSITTTSKSSQLGVNILSGRTDVTAAQLANCSVAEVTMTSGSQNITSWGGRSIAISLPVNGTNFSAGNRYTVYQISSNGSVETHGGYCSRQNGSLYVEVSTTHLSTFVIVPNQTNTNNTYLPFQDVSVSDWFYDDVAYAYNKGLFNGDSPTAFAPYGNMNRAMLVTVLHRFEGTPAVSQTSSFTDVASGQWFTNGVAWASSIGVVNGKGNGKFDPYGNITREEIATILYRYAKIKGWDVTASANLYSFNDGARTSDWATRAMQWAYAKGIINGKGGGTLDPSGYATRAEVAAMMRRFIEAY